MMFLFTFLGFLLVVAVIAITIWKSQHNKHLARIQLQAENNRWDDEKVQRLLQAEAFPIPKWTRPILTAAAVAAFGVGTFHSVFFYAEPGYIYHVRTITGEERVIDSTGYSYYLFGRYNSWKKAMTVQASNKAKVESNNAENDSDDSSSNLPPLKVIMLDQVDSAVSATARFRIPTDRESFLKMAHDYRTPDNLLNTALVPAFQETLQATGSLMGAEEYYSGGRTEFNAQFENQMQLGIYLVERKEVLVEDTTSDVDATAASNLGTDQTKFGDSRRVKFIVEKRLGADGQPLRKAQKFVQYGIQLVESRVTDLVPNQKFAERMQLKQQAAADRAIAREKRVQEEEQKLLVVAKGDREIAEKQAIAKQTQIEKTTNADTEKQLALIEASKLFEQAEIDKKTAKVRKEQADIDAQRIKVLADADKYEREMRIKGDNALDKKLEAEIRIQAVWADAYAKRNVPTNVFGAGTGSSTAPTGSDTEVSNFMKLMTLDAAKRLNYDRGIDKIEQK